jgi:hypothetical protein
VSDPIGYVPYASANAGDVTVFWETAKKHRGVEELRAKRRRPPKAETDREEQIALRLDAECSPTIGALARSGRPV